MAFDFKKNLIKVQGRQYLPVSARIVWFREMHPDWAIVTEPVEINHEKQYAVFRATVFNADNKIMATGTKKEDVKGFGDYIEKSETGAVGRALALCGFGTQFSPELDEVGGGRLADSPQPMGGRYNGSYGGGGNYQDQNRSRYGNDERSGNGGSPSSRPFSAPSGPPNGAGNRSAEAIRDSAPAALSSDEDDDDFDRLSDIAPIHASAGKEIFPADTSAPKSAPVKAETRSDGAPACGSCGKALTKAQQELSLRNFGEALCPSCQRDKPRNGRVAVAEH